ncbi:hypothetical protein Pmani_032623 [Petrolisthes manimaculis]|uniref:Otopetrin-2 n=1 Tax=Petrolisthes manimaculis TaxID=1843537 RepID=A0AAE1NT98_9EUCA|nr:hypothetical protein Pmani_032623 [Petrolisthes manimaculis]
MTKTRLCHRPSRQNFSQQYTCSSLVNESEVSGSGGLASPAQSRRRVHHPRSLPQHPHRRRKVSAPPELQQHLGGSPIQPSHAHGYHHHPHHHYQGGANPDHSGDNKSSSTVSNTPEYILSLSPQTHVSTGFYSGSDSGVPSEYSYTTGSWAPPVTTVGGVVRRDVILPENNNINNGSGNINLSPSVSVDDLAAQRQTTEHLQQQQAPTFYQSSDSECESVDDVQISQGRHKVSSRGGGMNNPAYTHTETTAPMVLPVGSPPPLSRISTEPIMTSPSPSMPGSSGVYGAHGRRHSHNMVLQLNLQGAPHSVPISSLAPGRSVSMVSLTGQQQGSVPSIYPNLHNDNQSIYSDVGYNPPPVFQHLTGAQASPPAGIVKVVESQHHHSHNPLGDVVGVPTSVNTNIPDHHHDPNNPQPTEECEKKSWFQHTLSENMSIIYAVFLVTLGLVIYLADTFSGHDSAMAEGFNVFLISTQLLWLFFVHVDVRRYVSLISRALDEAKTRQVNKDDQVHLEPTGDGQYQLRFNVPEAPRTVPQYYGFTSGRHGGSLYLKIGATVFCLGYLIHTGLNLGQKILYLTEDDPVFDDCTCTTDVVMSVLMPVYAFYQLFFIFKYSNLIINRRVVLSRFGIMHCIAASLCFWVYTIMQETLQAIFMKKSHGGSYDSTTDASVATAAALMSGDDDSEEMDDEDVNPYTGSKLSGGYSTASSWSINYGCEKDTHLSDMINATTPYLYPFSIEFNILMVGLWILLWENIGKIERHTHIPSVEVTYEEDNSKSLTSNLIIYVDCHASNRGLFAGLLMTVATVISIILFFIFSSSDDQQTRDVGAYVNGISEVILLLCMLITAFIAYNSIRMLDVIKHGMSSVDDILLYVCLPCIFLYAFFSMVPSINAGNYLSVSVSILQVSQVILQTALICDGLRRCSNDQSLQHKKPGREVITYLVVTNVAMWLLQTFEIKSAEGNATLYYFYGKELWTLLSHLTLPLALFYRFHSSVCLADMWKASYEAEEAH